MIENGPEGFHLIGTTARPRPSRAVVAREEDGDGSTRCPRAICSPDSEPRSGEVFFPLSLTRTEFGWSDGEVSALYCGTYVYNDVLKK